MADVPAMIGALADGLLRRLNDPRGRAMPLEVAHACPPLDPCAGSDAGHVWEAIGSIAATGPACRRRPHRPSEYFVFFKFPRRYT